MPVLPSNPGQTWRQNFKHRQSALLGRPAGPYISTLIDDFPGAAFSSQWNVDLGGWAVSGGLASAAVTSGYAQLSSTTKNYTLTGKQFVTSLSTLPNVGNGSTQLSLKLFAGDANKNYLQFMWSNGNISATYRTDGVPTTASVASSDLWWRARESQGTTYLDTGTDGINWTNRATFTTPSWMSDGLTVQWLTGYYGTEPTPGTASIDSVNFSTLTGTPAAGGVLWSAGAENGTLNDASRPLPAQPGQTWLRRFKHPQSLPPNPVLAAVPLVGSANAGAVDAVGPQQNTTAGLVGTLSAGRVDVSGPQQASTAWLVGTASAGAADFAGATASGGTALTGTPSAGQVTVGGAQETGTLGLTGTASAGQATTAGPQETGALSLVGTQSAGAVNVAGPTEAGALSLTGTATAGAADVAGPVELGTANDASRPLTAQPGQTWMRQFKRRQVLQSWSQSSATSLTGTASAGAAAAVGPAQTTTANLVGTATAGQATVTGPQQASSAALTGSAAAGVATVAGPGQTAAVGLLGTATAGQATTTAPNGNGTYAIAGTATAGQINTRGPQQVGNVGAPNLTGSAGAGSATVTGGPAATSTLSPYTPRIPGGTTGRGNAGATGRTSGGTTARSGTGTTPRDNTGTTPRGVELL